MPSGTGLSHLLARRAGGPAGFPRLAKTPLPPLIILALAALAASPRAWGAACDEGRERAACELRAEHFECRRALARQRLAVLERKAGRGTQEQQSRIPAARAKFERDLDEADRMLAALRERGTHPDCARPTGYGALKLAGNVGFCRRISETTNECRTASLGYALQPGDIVVTGKDGRAELRYGDGGEVQLGPSTEFVIEADGVGLLRKGELFFKRLAAALAGKAGPKFRRPDSDDPRAASRAELPPELKIRTPGAVTAVRGTRFRLFIGVDGVTHLGPEEGIIELTATGKAAAPDAWWAALEPSSGESGDERVLLRPSDGALIRGPGEREARAGDALVEGQTLVAGKGPVVIGLGRGAWAALKPRSRVGFPASKAVAELRSGAMFVKAGGPGSTTISAQGSILCTLENGAVELALGEDGKPDVAVHEGAVLVEAAQPRSAQ